MRNIKKALFFWIAVCTAQGVSAQFPDGNPNATGTENIIYTYNYSDRTATVRKSGITDATKGYQGNVVIPDSVYLPSPFDHWYKVIGVDAAAFKNCTLLKSVSLPKGCTTIGDSAFYNTGMTSITIPDLQGPVGAYAFGRCKSLVSFDAGNGLTSVGKGIFIDDDQLADFAMSSALTSIGDSAFYGTAITAISLPDGFTGGAGDYSFAECKKLVSFDSGNGMTSTGALMFYNDSLLTNVRIGSNVTTLARLMFYHCPGMRTATKLVIPAKVTNVGNIFGLENEPYWELDSLIIEDSETAIGNRGWNSGVLERINVHNYYIGRNITNLRIANASTYESLTIGPKVTALSSYLSSRRTETYMPLKTVRTLNTDPSALTPTFSSVIYNQATLIVPDGTLDAYKAATGWKDFYNIVEASTYATGVNAVKAAQGNATETARYSIDGATLGLPRKGVNIVKTGDGKVRKVIVK